VAALLLVVAADVAHGDDGSMTWRTLESEHFVVHYHEPLEDVGRKVVAAAERSHAVLAPVFSHEPREKTHVVLRDTTDSANGFASVIPRNQITLFVSAPRGTSVLNDHDDWLYGLFVHEYTHILHLDAIGGLPFWYNRIFGKTWSPNQIQPRWVIEGLATHEESKRSSGGRTRSARFDMELRVAALANQEIKLDAMSSGPAGWPHGSAAYLYGGHFMKWLFDRFGEDRVKTMTWSYGSSPIPYGLSHSLKEATGKRLDELYDQWVVFLRDKYRTQLEAIERRGRIEGRRLTFTGEGTRDPRFTPTGDRLVFWESDLRSRARFRSLAAGKNAASATDYARVDRAGGFDVLSDGSLVVEQSVNFRTNYSFQDLFLWKDNSLPMTRLTRGQRARDPAVSPDERRVAFSMNRHSKSVLAVIPLRPDAKAEVVFEGPGRYDQVSAPEWSPDGSRITFSAWRDGGYRDILVVDVRSRKVVEITHDRALDTDPIFTPDGRFILFSSDRDGVYNIYAKAVEGGRLMQVTNVVGAALLPEVSPDGRRLVYQGFAVGGFDLYELELDESRWRPAAVYIDDRPDPVVVPHGKADLAKRDYRPLETLAPQAYTYALTTNSLGQALTVTTDGNDVIGRHTYTLAGTLLLDDGGVSAAGSYSYNRFWPRLRVAVSRNAARRSGVEIDGRNTLFIEEVMGLTAGFSLPVHRDAWARANLSIDYDFDWLRNTGDEYEMPDPNDLVPVFPETDVFLTALALRFSYSDDRRFAYRIGEQQGKSISLSARLNHSALGGDFDSLDLSYRLNWYRDLPFSPTSSVSARFSGGLRATNRRRSGVFAIGGVPEQEIVNSILNNLRASGTGYLRGFAGRSIRGRQFHLLNFELRQQLLWVERGVSSLPVYFRRIHFAGLADVGDAFDGSFDLESLNLSVGAALRADILLGYSVPASFDIGYSRGVTSGGIGEYWVLVTGTL